jgi:hypothetical protein
VKLAVAPERVRAAPGEPISLVARITNDSSHPATYRVRVVGLDRRWWRAVDAIGPVPPSEAVEVAFQVELPAGFPAGEHTIAIEAAESAGRGGPQRPPAPQRGVVLLVVGAARELTLQLEPPHVVGRRKESIGAAVYNKDGDAVTVVLRGESPDDDLWFGFTPARITLEPGQRRVVPVELRGRQPRWGDPRLRPFTITAQTAGEPVQAAGSFTQKPWLPTWWMKALAILAVLALWGAAMVIGLRRLTADEQEPATAADIAAIDNGSGEGVDGGDGQGGGAGGEGGAGAEGGEAGAGGDGKSTTEVGGLILNDDPGGVLILIRPVSLVEEESEQAELAGARQQGLRSPIFKLMGPLVSQESPQAQFETMSMTTTEDGEWGFAGIPAPGFYEVQFAKAGYGTASHIVTLSEEADPQTLDVTLEPGDGAISGLVTADGAPLGGVDVTITDGTVTYTTRTPTSGEVGRWSVSGIGTPATYLVTFSRSGFGTETALIELPAGGSDTVNVSMRPGVGSVTGMVVDQRGTALGGLEVVASNGTGTECSSPAAQPAATAAPTTPAGGGAAGVCRRTSTLTEGAVGSYLIPQLEVPGTYTISVSGAGWQSQTQSVTLDAASVANATGVDFVMVPTTATVFGTVTGQPDNLGLDSVAISASDGTNTFKTTSAANGDYELAGLPPGTYVITFERFGFHPASVVLSLAAGQVEPFDPPPLAVRPQNPPESNTVLSGVISDSVSNLPVTESVEVEVIGALCDDNDVAVACITSAEGNGTYRFEGLPAGAYTIAFRPARGYEPFSTTIRLPAGTNENLDVALVPWGTVRGIVTGVLVAGTPPSPLGGVVVTAPGTSCPAPDPEDPPVVCNDTTSTTAPIGEYELLRAFPGGAGGATYTVNYARPGFSGSVTFTIRSGQVLNISPELTRAPEIFGVVYNGNPRAAPPQFPPVPPGATVSISGPGGVATATTGADGRYSAWVCDAAGVTVPPPSPPFAAGLRSCLAPGLQTVTVSAPGFATEVTTVTVAANQAVRVDVALFPTPVFTTGRVVWVDGDVDVPVAGAVIQVEAVVDVRWVGFDFVFDTRTYSATTDANGCFRIPAATGDPRPILYLRPAFVGGNPLFFDRSDVQLQPVEGGCVPNTANRVVLTPRPGNIQAFVTTDPPDLAFMSTLTVTATRGTQTLTGQIVPLLPTLAMAVFPGVPAGTWDLRYSIGATHESFITEVLVTPGATAVPATAVLRKLARLELAVHNSVTGAPIADSTVTIDRPDQSVSVSGGQATAILEPGSYVITPSGGGSRTVTLEPGGFSLVANGTTVVTVAFRGEYRLTVSGAFSGTLTFDRRYAPPQSVGNNEVFTGLVPATYTVSVSRANYEPTQIAVTLQSGADSIVAVPLAPFARLTVRVTNAAGALLPGAAVAVTPLTPPGPVVPGTTGSNGEAGFDLRAGTYRIVVTAGGGSSQPADVVLTAGQQLVHPVALVNRVIGQVNAGASPLQGATVVATLGGTEVGRFGPTPSSGVYSIGGLGIGSHTVTASAEGHVTSAGQTANFTSFGNELALTFNLVPVPPPPPPGAPDGIVSSSSGEPLAGVAITATNLLGDTLETTSGADGTWTLTGGVGSTWRITYYAEGYHTLTTLAASNSSGGGLLDVALAAKGSFLAGSTFGRAANDGDPGTPLDGVTVTLLDGTLQEMATQAVRPVAGGFGYAFVDLDPGAYTLRFERAGYQSLEVPVELEERADAVVDATLAALNGRLSVLIRGPTGSQVGGAQVRLVSPSRLPGGRSAVTGPDGRAEFDDLVPAGDYAVEAEGGPGVGAASAGPLSIAPGQTDAAVTLTLVAPAVITGTVLVQASAATPPVPTDGVEVVLFAEDSGRVVGTSASGATGAAGGYRFDAVEAGDYRLEFRLAGHEAITRTGVSVAPSGDAVVDVTVRRLARLVLSVVDSTATPVGGATVAVAGRTATTTPAGVAVLDDLPLGPAVVEVGGSRTQIDLQPGEQRLSITV